MDSAGGLTFYRTNQSQPLLAWAFAAACLTTFLVVNLPQFRREDTLDPELQRTENQWCAPPARRRIRAADCCRVCTRMRPPARRVRPVPDIEFQPMNVSYVIPTHSLASAGVAKADHRITSHPAQ